MLWLALTILAFFARAADVVVWVADPSNGNPTFDHIDDACKPDGKPLLCYNSTHNVANVLTGQVFTPALGGGMTLLANSGTEMLDGSNYAFKILGKTGALIGIGVWTGCTLNGQPDSDNNCDGFTSHSSTLTGALGLPTHSKPLNWIHHTIAQCSASDFPVYCYSTLTPSPTLGPTSPTSSPTTSSPTTSSPTSSPTTSSPTTSSPTTSSPTTSSPTTSSPTSSPTRAPTTAAPTKFCNSLVRCYDCNRAGCGWFQSSTAMGCIPKSSCTNSVNCPSVCPEARSSSSFCTGYCGVSNRLGCSCSAGCQGSTCCRDFNYSCPM